jgi:hypothetical protein
MKRRSMAPRLEEQPLKRRVLADPEASPGEIKIGAPGTIASHSFAKNAKEWGILLSGAGKVSQPSIRELVIPLPRTVEHIEPAQDAMNDGPQNRMVQLEGKDDGQS